MAWTAFANHSSIHFSLFFKTKSIVSVFNSEGPPVPIPNTEVKLVCANNTRLEAAREDRSMLTRENEVIRPRFFLRSVKNCTTKNACNLMCEQRGTEIHISPFVFYKVKIRKRILNLKRFSTHFYFASCRLLQHARKKAFCSPLPSLVARLSNRQ